MFSVFNFSERELLNGKYRYEGSYYNIRYAIDSNVKKAKQEIERFLENKSVETLVNNEGYVIDFQ